MEARSQIGGRGAAATGTAATKSRRGPIRGSQRSRARFPEAAVAGESSRVTEITFVRLPLIELVATEISSILLLILMLRD